MRQLTIRGFPAELEKRLRTIARERGVSLNKAALFLMRKGAGLNVPHEQPNTIGTALDAYIGSWSDKDERAVLEAVEDFEHIDEGLWR